MYRAWRDYVRAGYSYRHYQPVLQNPRKQHSLLLFGPMDPESCEHVPEKGEEWDKIQDGDEVLCTKCECKIKVLRWPMARGKRKYLGDISLKDLLDSGIRSIIGDGGLRSATSQCRDQSSEFSKCEKPTLWSGTRSPVVMNMMLAAIKKDLNKDPTFKELFEAYWFEDDVLLKKIAYQMYESKREEMRKKREREQRKKEGEGEADVESEKEAEKEKLEEEAENEKQRRAEEERRRAMRDDLWS